MNDDGKSFLLGILLGLVIMFFISGVFVSFAITTDLHERITKKFIPKTCYFFGF